MGLLIPPIAETTGAERHQSEFGSLGGNQMIGFGSLSHFTHHPAGKDRFGSSACNPGSIKKKATDSGAGRGKQ
jgi:hypothetical protein